MINTIKKEQIVDSVVSVECDVCGKIIAVHDNQLDEDCLNIAKTWGKNSGFAKQNNGEQIHHKFDLCEDCYRKILDQFSIRVHTIKVQTIEIR